MDYKTAYPKIIALPESKICVEVRVRRPNDKDILVVGYAISKKTNQKMSKQPDASMQITSVLELESAEKLVASRIRQKYDAVTKSILGAVESDEQSFFSGYFGALSPEEWLDICSPSWEAATTRKNNISYIVNQILPILDKYGPDVTAEELKSIPGRLAEIASKNPISRGDSEYSLRTSVRQNVQNFNNLYRRAQHSSGGRLPDIVIPEVEGEKLPQREQIKSIPGEVRVKFSQLLWRLSHHGLSLGAVLMLTGMLRTGEACAPKFGDFDIKENGQYMLYCVEKQVADGKIVPALKTKNAYRRAIFPHFTVVCVEKRKQYLREKGYSDAEIGEMYVVSKAYDPTQLEDPKQLSKFVRKLLIKAGFTQKDLDLAEETMRNDPDIMEDGTAIEDLCAYVLRRAGCTLLVNACGLPRALVDLLMGHELSREEKTKWKLYVQKPENYGVIAEMLERVIFVPDHSYHPKFRPVALNENAKYKSSSVDQQGFVIKNTSEQHRTGVLKISGREPGQPIILRVRKNRVQINHVISENFLERHTEAFAVVGKVLEREVYEKYVKSADSIDLSAFEKEWKLNG